MKLPSGLTQQEHAWPIIFVDTGELDIADSNVQRKINDALHRSLCKIHPTGVSGQTLLKVHVGEPKCVTRMKPEYAASSVRFLREQGATGIVAGDSTVAYSGPRGHRQNQAGDVSPYLELARQHGWSVGSPIGIPFVVLDRPYTAVPGQLEFGEEQEQIELEGIHRFKDFFLAGGFVAADFVINHAHLTLHGLAGLAGCVKSVAMGCSSLRGKLRMHQSLVPHFSPDLCEGCGQCVESCPENALKIDDGDMYPLVDPELCIGCGECEGICDQRAVTLQGKEISDWQRGESTLPVRMVDYTMGLMNNKWENTIHVLHMYNVTERCDCLDIRQLPLFQRDLGFLVGKNPFAIDLLASRLLAGEPRAEGHNVDESLLKAAEQTASYAEESYGTLRKTPVEKINVP